MGEQVSNDEKRRLIETALKAEPFDWHAYSEAAHSAAIYPNECAEQALEYLAMGITEEAGEVVGKIKKCERDAAGIWSPERRQGLLIELGDVLWYLNEIVRLRGEVDSILVAVASGEFGTNNAYGRCGLRLAFRAASFGCSEILPSMHGPILFGHAFSLAFELLACCNYYGASLEDVARLNLQKILGRMERGTIGGAGDAR